MKKSKLLPIFLAFFLLFCSCGNSENASVTQRESTSEAVTLTQSEISEQASYTDTDADETQQENKKSNADSPEAQNTSASSLQSGTSEPINTAQSTQAEQNKEPNTLNVTFSVECKNAIDYGILNIGTFSEILSPDGIILPETSVKAEQGTSVVKALKAVLKDNNITYKITSSGYVKTINGLSEFDCGEASGWLYLVNGELPSVSAKSYILKDGDKVEFRYTCVAGDV